MKIRISNLGMVSMGDLNALVSAFGLSRSARMLSSMQQEPRVSPMGLAIGEYIGKEENKEGHELPKFVYGSMDFVE